MCWKKCSRHFGLTQNRLSLKWPTAKAILELRRGEGGLPYTAAETARAHFDRLQIATAKRVVRFYQVRRASGEIK